VADEGGKQENGDAWGDTIAPERQAKLEALFLRQAEWAAKPEAEREESAFKDVRLTGADVFWLAARALAGTNEAQAVAEQMGRLRQAQGDKELRIRLSLEALHLERANLAGVRLERANLAGAHLERANLAGAHLERAGLYDAHLKRAYLAGAHLEDATLGIANLEGAYLREAYLERAGLYDAHLERAVLGEAHLERAYLAGAHLEGAGLYDARLERAALERAHLEGANLRDAHLEDADLNHAYFDSATDLTDAVMSDQTGWAATALRVLRRQRRYGAVSLADVRWNGADLTVVDWSGLRRLGDERGERWWWRDRYEAETATRANIQFSKQLDNAGLKDDSDRFAYRAQVCQRAVHLRRFRLGRWLFSWLLFIIAGYGYRPLRTLFWYLAVIGAFAFAYHTVGPSVGVPLSPLGSLVFSVTSFHGRGFFPGGSPGHSVTLDDPLTVLAAAEAVLGLFIEISFIATFTQRYFGK
jgi:uncharacterized protein YjbI with pentapeptide repeats